jgi:uncharacterized protein (DUF2147 family)
MHKTLTIAAALCLASAAALAQSSPAGLWRTIDDDGKTEKSHVRITEAGGTLSGRIEKIADPSKQSARCADCEGARKDQPVLGMTIIEGVRRSSGGEHWDSGTILDPNNGKTYKVRMTLKDGGRALDVRGYVGTPLLGRTQTWQRVE